jgi:hypothetical protein
MSRLLHVLGNLLIRTSEHMYDAHWSGSKTYFNPGGQVVMS